MDIQVRWSHLDVEGPVVLAGGLAELPDGVRQVGRERSVDVRFQFRQVDLDDLRRKETKNA